MATTKVTAKIEVEFETNSEAQAGLAKYARGWALAAG
jgi:hypothetical protein